MILRALPEEMKSEAISSRATSTVELLFRVLKKYQPGGLSERTHVLKQLVEAKQPGTVAEMVNGLQLWMRWFKRAKELHIDIPDATLLMGALDRMSQALVKASSQSASAELCQGGFARGCAAYPGWSSRLCRDAPSRGRGCLPRGGCQGGPQGEGRGF